MNHVSIVIPVYDGAVVTRACLDALIDQELDAEIVVVDDASSDETSLLLESYGDKITTLRNSANAGYAATTNRGVAATSSELVVLLNNDTIPRAGWLAALVDYADLHPEAGIIGSKLLYPDGRIQHAGVAFNRHGDPYHLYARFPGDHPATNRSRRFQVVTAACMLVRRSVLDALGGFDEGFVNSAEDVDLCLRAGALGHEVHYCADSVLVHVESATRGREIQRQSELLYRHRWRGRVRYDELEYMVDDGLIQVGYGPLGRVTLRVDPLLGTAEATDPLATERVVDELTARWLEVLVERDELLSELRRRTPVPIEFDAVGVARSTEHPLRASTPAEQTWDRSAFLARKVEPLPLRVTRHAPPRVNVLFEGLQDATTYGGHASMLQFACALHAAGRRVRIVGVDVPADRSLLSRAAREIDGAASLIDIDYADVSDRMRPIDVSPDDRFVATSWWTMHVADHARRRLAAPPPLWIVQEYEPLFYPAGSFAAAARAAYDMPHAALVSTPLLADFLAARSIGAARHGWPTVVFQNPLTTIEPPDQASLARPTIRRLLAYLREAPRNLSETVIAGIELANRRGDLPADWSVTGIGGDLTRTSRLDLAGGRAIEMFDRLSPGRYRAMLRSHDVGVALQDTPHPGLVALDMAAAGMTVVSSTYEGKTAAALAAISPNIVGVAPTPADLADAIAQQIAAVDDLSARAAGADVDWPRTAAEAFTDELMTEVGALIDG